MNLFDKYGGTEFKHMETMSFPHWLEYHFTKCYFEQFNS